MTALLASACGSTPAAANSPSASASAAASPSASPTATKLCTPSSRCFALVTLRGSNRVVVRDLTDISHPTTVSTASEALSIPQFVTANELSGIDYSVQKNGLIRMSFGGSTTTVVPDSGRLTGYYDWSPDGSTLVYLTSSATTVNSVMALHQLTATGDRVLDGSIPALPAVGCESQFCPLAEGWDARLAYSTDGATISFVASIANVKIFRLWASDGKLLVSGSAPARTMSVWSGNSLYFLDANGIETWREGLTAPFLSGMAWIRPNASPAGGQIVYETRDAKHVAATFVVDTATRKIRELKGYRFDPHFLTARYVWYEGQRACVAADRCPTGWLAISSGKAYIYDLVAGTETESIITGVYDVWPHPA